ncbi:MAG TPA: 2-phosphosulfolactate phosphatase [Candidatus Kapabacteria bacterium]|nr:2-phosphosulfolactate phosphatase [Candidatus Kapabacteria bacterium]
MIKVRVYFSPQHIDELVLRDKTVVVIDVLRASTTITYAMAAGAREIIPVGSVDQAMKIVGNLFSTSTILCGERGGKRIEGFKLGNSPAEYTPESVEGKSLILTTTNGAVALTRSKYARHCFISSFVNLSASVHALNELPDLEETGLIIICSGREDDFSLEDATCAGLLLAALSTRKELELTDSARTVLSIAKEYGNDILSTLQQSDHGKYLTSIGFADDIVTASTIDALPLVPVLEQNAIKKKLIFT